MTEQELRILIDSAVKRALDEKVDEIAAKVEQRFYARFGQTTFTKLLQLIGIAAVAAALFFAGKGFIKP